MNKQMMTTPLGFPLADHEQMQTGTFEPLEVGFVTRSVGGCDVFVDVGANAGYFTCLARQRGRPAIAIGPSPANLELLYGNLIANGWSDVEVFPLGVSDRPRLETLYGDGTAASLVVRWAGTSVALRRTIPLSTLDMLLGNRFADARLLIKVDVEGAELSVLQGAGRTRARRRAPVWLMEVCFAENFERGINPHFREVFELFWRSGYTATSLDADRTVSEADVERWIAGGRRDFGYVSYVFAHRQDGAA